MTEYQHLLGNEERKTNDVVTNDNTNTTNDEASREQMQEAQNAVSLATLQLKFASTFAVPIFYLIAIVSVVCIILMALSIFGSVYFFVILGVTYVGALLGAYMTYKYGTLQEALKLLKRMNEEYGHEIDVLRSSSQTLQKEVGTIQSSVENLQHNQEELQGHLKEFDELREQLQSICKDNENIGDALHRVNNIMYDMKDVIRRNESAQLLSLYYDCAFRDGNLGLSKEEYDRFLGRLSVHQRKRFQDRGSFEQLLQIHNNADKDMSLQTFLKILQGILEEMDEEYLSMIKQ